MRIDTFHYCKGDSILVSIPIGNLPNNGTAHVNSVLEAVKKAFKDATVSHFITNELAENAAPSIAIVANITNTIGDDE